MSTETYGQEPLVAVVQAITVGEAVQQLSEKVTKLEAALVEFHTCLTCARHKLSGGSCSGTKEKARVVCENWVQGVPKTALDALAEFGHLIDLGWANEVTRLRELASYGLAPYRAWGKILPKGRAICSYCQHGEEECSSEIRWEDCITCISFQPLPLPKPELWRMKEKT